MLAVPRYAHVTFPALRGPHAPAVTFVAPPTGRAPSPAPRAAGVGPAEEAFLRHVLAGIGVDAGAYRAESLARRFRACLRALGVGSADEAWRVLAGDPRRLEVAADALLIGVTSFFRDEAVFQALEARILPDIVAGGRPVRVWSLGCSDGAELYSVAMLLGERDALEGSCLLGTDCRASAVARARAGRFDAESMAAIDDVRRARWFTPAGDAWRAAPALRAATRWWAADALAATEPGAWDLVLCRNVAMYLQPEVARDLWSRLAGALRRGGVLVIGKAERPTGTMRFSALGPGLYRRDGAAFGV